MRSQAFARCYDAVSHTIAQVNENVRAQEAHHHMMRVLTDEVHGGASVSDLLAAARTLEREAIYWHYPHYSNQGGFPGAAVREGRWKLIERFEDGRVQLFDLASDIGERRDVASEHPALVRSLRRGLHTWYREVDAKFLEAKKGGPEPWRPE